MKKRFLPTFLVFLPLLSLPPGLAQEKKTNSFVSSKACGQCHTAIYAGWKGSMHANAVKDPVFYSIFLETSRETGGKSDSLCLSCHAPVTRLTKDIKMNDPVTQEGVTCDFCHSVKEVKVGAKDPFVVSPGTTKWGPLPAGTSSPHGVERASHFDDVPFCGGCHEFVNERGVVLLGTYSEWKESPQAKEGKNCQSCHMPRVEGEKIAVGTKPAGEVYINSHEAAGGHSIEQVRKAVRLQIGEVKRDKDQVRVAVTLENVGSGHRVPTGLPTRKLVLSFQSLMGGTPGYSTERVFQKVIVNGKGEVITKDADLFLNAAAVKEDTRLEPRKMRTEYFDFIAPAEKAVELKIQLYYLYQPRLIQETEMKVNLGELKTVIQP